MPDHPSITDIERDLERATQATTPRPEAEAGTESAEPPSKINLVWRNTDPERRPEGMAWVVEDDEARLEYDAWAAQQEALSHLIADEADLVAFLAGYGAGKSITGARWLIMQALAYPGSRFLALGIDFAKARDTTFRVLFNQLPGDRTAVVTSAYNGPENSPIVADYNRAEHRLVLENDTVIKLGSADKWNRYAGDEYGGVWMDEPSHYGEDLHDLLEMMGSRLRGVEGPKVMFWTLTGNGYNSAYTILEEREGAEGDPLGLNIELVRASTLENPYLDDADKERFKRQYAGTAREEQALHGGFAAAQGLVYSDFSRDTHVIPHGDAISSVSDEWRIYGYDAGWNDPRVLLEIGKTSYDQLVVVDEYREHETHVEDAIAWLTENEKPNGTIYAEHEPSDIEKFREAGWPAEKADKSLDAGISEVRRRLEADDADQPGLLISDRCEHLIREFLGYKEEHVGTTQAVDHGLDGLRYAVHSDTAGGGDGAAQSGFIITRSGGISGSGARSGGRWW